MNKIKITAKTERGKEALEQHINDSRKMGFRKKAMMKVIGISQKITVTNPLTLEVCFTNKRISQVIHPEHFTAEIYKFMESFGVEKDKDYCVEVE